MAYYDSSEIQKRMSDALKNPVSKLEGTFSMDNIQATSQELSRMYYMDIKTIPDKVLIDTAEEDYLDRAALDSYLSRRQATYATGMITFSGSAGIVIPTGTVIKSASMSFSTLKDATIPSAGKVAIEAQCLTAGKAGNVAAGSIKDFSSESKIDGVTAINERAFAGGIDTENDDQFRTRLLEDARNPKGSGTENDYVGWSKEVPGVGNAICIPLYNGRGTVGIFILSDQGDIPFDTVVANTKAFIETKRPVGADVTVYKAVPKDITISCTVKLENGYDQGEVEALIAKAINSYLLEKPFGINKEFSYFKVSDLLFSVAGISDVIDYTINGSKVSLTALPQEFFRIQGVTIHAS